MVSRRTSILGSLLNLLTMCCLAKGGTAPSNRKYETSGKCRLSRSFSTMSNIAFSWQNINARCWLTESVSSTPMPQSSKSCLKSKTINTTTTKQGNSIKAYFRAGSLAECSMSSKLLFTRANSCVIRCFSGCCAVSTSFGWLHTFCR